MEDNIFMIYKFFIVFVTFDNKYKTERSLATINELKCKIVYLVLTTYNDKSLELLCKAKRPLAKIKELNCLPGPYHQQ